MHVFWNFSCKWVLRWDDLGFVLADAVEAGLSPAEWRIRIEHRLVRCGVISHEISVADHVVLDMSFVVGIGELLVRVLGN